MKILIFLLISNFALAIDPKDSSLYIRHGLPPLPTVPFVKLEKYVGKWFVISALPQPFSKNCIGQTSEYRMLTKNSLSILKTCIQEKGKTSTVKGKAIVINPITNSELEVTFENFLNKLIYKKGDYTIFKIDKNYEFVMVGSKDRKSLSIMSRKSSMPKKVLDQYVDLAKKNGFEVNKLKFSKY